MNNRLTVGELRQLEHRIKEIDGIVDLCHPDFDSDVLDNLEIELKAISETLKSSLDLVRGAS